MKTIIYGPIWIRILSTISISNHSTKKCSICRVQLVELYFGERPILAGVGEAATDVAVEEEGAGFYSDILVGEKIFSLGELAFGVLDAVVELGPASAYFIRADLRAKILK